MSNIIKPMPLISLSHFSSLLLDNVPMMDLRAPIEFDKGSFPNTTHLPLMQDDEREKVGTCYKKKGQEAAITLGHELVQGEVKQQRLAQWIEFTKQHPQGALYCFRGGLRSKTVQTWLADAGISYPRVEGGYKALRQFLISELERLCHSMRFIVVSGYTGSNKTGLINQIENSIDLEGLANHRGSSFGQRVDGQPTQIDFENSLAIALMRAEAQGHKVIVLEDESHLIGRCAIPLCLGIETKKAPIVELVCPIEERKALIHQQYVVDQLTSFHQRLGKVLGDEAFNEYLVTSLTKIKKRLGDVRFNEIMQKMLSALNAQYQCNDFSQHYFWIDALLSNYYDSMYSYQINKKSERIVAKGNKESMLTFLLTQCSRCI